MTVSIKYKAIQFLLFGSNSIPATAKIISFRIIVISSNVKLKRCQIFQLNSWVLSLENDGAIIFLDVHKNIVFLDVHKISAL